jgi:hypothetical protein
MSKKSEGYSLGGIGIALTAILAIIGLNLGWNLSGQIFGSVALLVGIFSGLTFWKPETFAPALAGIFEYLASLGEDQNQKNKVTQKQNKTKHSHQINGSGNNITYNITKNSKNR